MENIGEMLLFGLPVLGGLLILEASMVGKPWNRQTVQTLIGALLIFFPFMWSFHSRYIIPMGNQASWGFFVLIAIIIVGGSLWVFVSRRTTQIRDNQTVTDGVAIETYDDIRHEVIPDRIGPYFMGERLDFTVKMQNQLNVACNKDFWYAIQLPDSQFVMRRTGTLNFAPNEIKTINLNPGIFLGFLGIIRVIIMVGQTANLLSGTGNLPQVINYLTLFSAQSRDREGYQINRNMLNLTSELRWLTVVLIVLTATLVIFTVGVKST